MVHIRNSIFVFGGVLILFYTILDLLDGQPISFFSRLLRVITFQGIDALWFIPVYCFSEIIMKIIYKYKWRDIIISFVFLIICISTKSTIHIGSTIYKIMLGICFVEIGILIEQYLIIEKLGRIKYILLIIAAMLAQVNGSVEMIEGRIGNPVVYFLCATMTSVSVLALFKNAESNNSKLLLVLEKYGKNTIHLFVRKIFGHFGAFMVCSFFALMTMIFFFKNNYLRFGLAFLNGVFLAVLTEFIQYNTIGRYGTIKDVCIDLAGYSSMMIIIGVIMIIIYLVRKGKRNDEKKYI